MMNFYINRRATLPILKLQLIYNGRHDFRKFYEKLQNSNIFFSMFDTETDQPIICRALAGCQIMKNEHGVEEYYITYQFNSEQTSKPGSYYGQFIIDFLDNSGVLIVPIREKLIINILN